MEGLISVVESDVEGAGVGLRCRVEHDPDALQAGEVAQGRGFGIRGVLRGRVDGEDIEVLVAGVVLHKDDGLAVTRPKEHRDGAGGFGGEQAGVDEGFAGFLNPDVAGTLPGLEKRQIFTVRGNARGGDFRVAEEEFAIDEWGEPLLGQ